MPPPAATFLTLTRRDFRADGGAGLNRGDVDTLLLFILWDAFLVYYIGEIKKKKKKKEPAASHCAERAQDSSSLSSPLYLSRKKVTFETPEN